MGQKKAVTKKPIKKTTKKKTTVGYEEKQAQDLENLGQDIEPENQPEEKKLQEEPSPLSPTFVIDPETIMFFVSAPFNKLAEERGEHWRLTEYEKTQILAYIEKFDAKYGKYIPAWLAKYSLEFSGIAFLVGLITSRKSKDKALYSVEHKEKTPEEPAKEPMPEPGKPIITE